VNIGRSDLADNTLDANVSQMHVDGKDASVHILAVRPLLVSSPGVPRKD
jgi:hypothetical protein